MAKEQQAPASTPKVTLAKKATITTETILGKAAIKLEAGVKALVEASQELGNLVSTSEELTLKIAQQEQQKEELKAAFEEELRSGKVELQNQLKEDAKTLAAKVLSENSMVAIAKEELDQLKKELNELKTNFDKQKTSEITAAMSAKQKEFDAAKALYEATAKAENATIQSQVKTLEDKVAFLTEQNENLHKQLDKAGERAVQIAQAGSIQTLNLGGESSRK